MKKRKIDEQAELLLNEFKEMLLKRSLLEIEPVKS